VCASQLLREGDCTYDPGQVLENKKKLYSHTLDIDDRFFPRYLRV